MILEAVVVLGLAGAIIYGTILLFTRPPGQHRSPSYAGQWRTAHYDLKGQTHVVVERVSPTGRDVLDEHVISTIPVDDPEYDTKFLLAMSAARERRALFESEADD